jgi:opacity protein-like surface antigen
MRILAAAFLVAITAPALASDRDAAIADRITKELNEKGPVGYIGQLCDRLNGVPVWGGVRSPQKQNVRELNGSGVKLTCGSDGRVGEVELKGGFSGPLPNNTTLSMRQKDVWKTLKKAGLKKQITKGKESGGRFVRFNHRKYPVTWKWNDPKGKQGVSAVIISK